MDFNRNLRIVRTSGSSYPFPYKNNVLWVHHDENNNPVSEIWDHGKWVPVTGVGSGSGDVIIDTKMSDSSSNAIANKTVKKYVDGIASNTDASILSLNEGVAALQSIIDTLNPGYQFMGVATPSTNPGTPDQKVFYIANGKDTYTNFGGISITEDEVVILYYDTAWHKLLTGIAPQEKLSKLQVNLYGDTSHEILDTTNEIVGMIYMLTFYSVNGKYPNWRCVLLNVSNYKGRTLRIVPRSTSLGTTYMPLKDNVLVSGENVNACDGWSNAVTVYTRTDITIPVDCNYLYVRIKNVSTEVDYTPQSLLILAVEGNLDKKVDKVVGKGLSTNDYTDDDKEKVATIPASFVTPSELDKYVQKEQGIVNAGLLLKVGQDGMVTLGVGGGVGPDISDCVRKEISKTLHLGENVLSGVVGAGNEWTENSGNYTHATGETSILEFPLATDSGDAYVAIFSSSVAENNEEAVTVSIGDGVPCDIYNGTLGPYYVGMVSDGGHLKITADANFSGTISGVELRKVVSEEDADISITLDSSDNKHYENVLSGTMRANITGWWNVAMGANDAMEANQNGSRNIAIGARSLSKMQGGARNIGIGTFALHRFVYGARNIAIGADAAWYITGGSDNIVIGKGALGEIRASQTVKNVVIGTKALGLASELDAVNNVAVGFRALSGGSGSIAKSGCVAVGDSAGVRNNTNCVAIGYNAAFYITGSGNVAVGKDAMNCYNVDGSNNTCIGHGAIIHSSTKPATINNAIAIGYGVKAKKSNQVVIGNADNDEFVLGNKKLVFNLDNTVSWETI